MGVQKNSVGILVSSVSFDMSRAELHSSECSHQRYTFATILRSFGADKISCTKQGCFVLVNSLVVPMNKGNALDLNLKSD